MILFRSAILSLIFCTILWVNSSSAQDHTEGSPKPTLPNSYPVKLYYNAIGENAHIYNGYEYMTPDSRIKGSPYFFTFNLFPGNITYDSSFYQDIPMLYDLVRDLIVIKQLNQNFKISLISEKVSSFTFQNHDFIRVNQDSVYGVDMVTGFYERAYTGKSAVLIKRKKIIFETIEYSTSSNQYKVQDVYYVAFNGKYVVVTNKKSVLKLFNSKKSQIKSYLRKNKLDFKSDFEKTLIATSRYYDQLTS